MSVSLNGSSQYLTIPDAASLQITSNLTVMAWILPSDATPNKSMIIFEKGSDDSSTTSSDILFACYSRQVEAKVRNGATQYRKTGSTVMSNSAPHHVAMVYTPSTSLEVFLDGVSDGSNTTSIPASITATSANCTIGRDVTASSRYFIDSIAEVRIWAASLTAAQIATEMRSQQPATNLSTLKLWLPLNNSALPATYTDFSQNGNTATPVGTPTVGNSASF